MKMNNFEKFVEVNKIIINEFAKDYINQIDSIKELKESIIYSLVNDGKKIRPMSFLFMLEYYGIDYTKYLDIGLALELVHTYSLVHDDLPAMDNDDYRWKKLTNHKVYGEDIAILTGDAMLTLAFELLSDSDINSLNKIKLIKLLSNYAGMSGMVEGQVYDIKQVNYSVDKEYLKKMHSLKTGKLIILPFIFAAIVAEKETEENLLVDFGRELGIAYQIKDDILDYYGEFENIGKLPSDEEKITYLSFYGIDESENLLKKHTENAINIARKLENNNLIDIANYLLNRKK